jgi:hypothetical protein
MRLWGRVYSEDGTYQWVQVTTADDGSNDYVYITNLIQVLKLSRNESPFYSNYGIPAQQSVLTQIFPDYYMNETQRQFAPYFASLIITSLPAAQPTYTINIVTHAGVVMNLSVPV